jgi:hypothetical protein
MKAQGLFWTEEENFQAKLFLYMNIRKIQENSGKFRKIIKIPESGYFPEVARHWTDTGHGI